MLRELSTYATKIGLEWDQPSQQFKQAPEQSRCEAKASRVALQAFQNAQICIENSIRAALNKPGVPFEKSLEKYALAKSFYREASNILNQDIAEKATTSLLSLFENACELSFDQDIFSQIDHLTTQMGLQHIRVNVEVPYTDNQEVIQTFKERLASLKDLAARKSALTLEIIANVHATDQDWLGGIEGCQKLCLLTRYPELFQFPVLVLKYCYPENSAVPEAFLDPLLIINKQSPKFPNLRSLTITSNGLLLRYTPINVFPLLHLFPNLEDLHLLKNLHFTKTPIDTRSSAHEEPLLPLEDLIANPAELPKIKALTLEIQPETFAHKVSFESLKNIFLHLERCIISYNEWFGAHSTNRKFDPLFQIGSLRSLTIDWSPDPHLSSEMPSFSPLMWDRFDASPNLRWLNVRSGIDGKTQLYKAFHKLAKKYPHLTITLVDVPIRDLSIIEGMSLGSIALHGFQETRTDNGFGISLEESKSGKVLCSLTFSDKTITASSRNAFPEEIVCEKRPCEEELEKAESLKKQKLPKLTLPIDT